MHISKLVRWSSILAAILLSAFAPLASAESEDEIRQFLYSKENTYGWMPVKGDISYDFFRDGRLHIQGPDGEATMWKGKWKLVGDKLTLINSDKKTSETVTVSIQGNKLLLDGKPYKRVTAE